MKVVHYTDGASFGGVEQVTLTLLAKLDRVRWTPLLLHHQDEDETPLSARARALGVPALCVPRLRSSAHTPLHMAGFTRRLRSERPVIFHAHLNWPLACQHGLLCALAARTPVVVTTTHIVTDTPAGRSLWLRQRMNGHVDCSIAVSQAVAEYLHTQIGIADERVTVIYNGVDELDERPGSVCQSPFGVHAQPDRFNVLTIARLVPQKGLDYLLESARLLPSVRFAIAGDGPERQYLEARIRALALSERVRLLGHREDVAHLLALADVCVLPSLYEGLPLVLLEAMMQGTPVIATDIAGVNEVIVVGETGLLVPASNPVALAQAIEQVLADPCLARRLGERGRQSARQRFSAARMVGEYDALYQRLLSMPGQSRG